MRFFEELSDFCPSCLVIFSICFYKTPRFIISTLERFIVFWNSRIQAVRVQVVMMTFRWLFWRLVVLVSKWNQAKTLIHSLLLCAQLKIWTSQDLLPFTWVWTVNLLQGLGKAPNFTPTHNTHTHTTQQCMYNKQDKRFIAHGKFHRKESVANLTFYNFSFNLGEISAVPSHRFGED